MTADLGSAAADREVPLANGRVMLLREYGDLLGTPVIALHGTPASRLMYSAAKSAGSLGLRLIAPDRWGYGGTSAHPEPRLPAFAADIARVADTLGIDRFSVLGVSGGGPYACALGTLLRDRVTALALVAPVGPIGGVADVKLAPFHHFCFRMLPHMPRTMRFIFRGFKRGLDSSADRAVRIAMVRSPAPDHRVMTHPGVRARFIAMFTEGLRPGVEGAVTDMLIFNRPWHLPLHEISAPSALWIGTADNNVPIDAACKLAAAIPGCELIELTDEGHLWVSVNYDRVLGWIAAKQKGAVRSAPSG
ncbi:MAG: alpha/beta fold hydrolase [Hyphomicrobiaceae bacterium]